MRAEAVRGRRLLRTAGGLGILLILYACNIIIEPEVDLEIPPFDLPAGASCADISSLDVPVAHLWVMTRVETATAGMANEIVGLTDHLREALARNGVAVSHTLIAPLARPSHWPKALHLSGCDLQAPASAVDYLRYYAQNAALPELDACEHDNLASLGVDFATVTLPWGQVTLPTPDAVIVAYVDTSARRHALGDCAYDGRGPVDYFSEAYADELRWGGYGGDYLSSFSTVHWAIVTPEENIDFAALAARCTAIEGFPPRLTDFLGASPSAYFVPFVGGMNSVRAGQGIVTDLCAALGSDSVDLLEAAFRERAP